MTQTRIGSLFESFTNVVVGFSISMISNLIVLPWFGFNVKMSDALWIGVIFTIISIVRSYCIRRVFNRIKKWNKST